MGVLRLASGEVLDGEGQLDRRLFVLRSGHLRATIQAGGSTIVLDELMPGSLLGEKALFRDAPWDIRYEAMEECELSMVDKPLLESTLASVPAFVGPLLYKLSQRLELEEKRLSLPAFQHAFILLLWHVATLDSITAHQDPQEACAVLGLGAAFNDFSARKVVRAFCALGLGNLDSSGLSVRSESLAGRLYSVLSARERRLPDPVWMLSAGEQRILNCWAEAAEQLGSRNKRIVEVPYADLLAALRRHVPGFALGVSALSRMEQAGLLRQEREGGLLVGNLPEIREILECHLLLDRISAELPTLHENF